MLDNVESPHHVVLVLWDAREPREWRAHARAAEPLLRDTARFFVEFERIDFAKLAEHRQIVTGAAADLEDCRVCRRIDEPADYLGKDLAAGAIPPVFLVVLGHLFVNGPFHQRKTHCRLSVKVTIGVTKSIGTIGAARPQAR